jgi:hypothetical protein
VFVVELFENSSKKLLECGKLHLNLLKDNWVYC